MDDLRPYLGKAYEAVARGASRDEADLEYKASSDLGLVTGLRPSSTSGVVEEVAQQQSSDPLQSALLEAIAARRKDELDRGISLVGPHRDELLLTLGNADLRLPVKGYASHGESWSFALALRLASYDLLRSEGDDPILILDDVFAELDTGRRDQLAELVSGAEQVLVTAAVAGDVPASLAGVRYVVEDGEVREDDDDA